MSKLYARLVHALSAPDHDAQVSRAETEVKEKHDTIGCGDLKPGEKVKRSPATLEYKTIDKRGQSRRLPPAGKKNKQEQHVFSVSVREDDCCG